VDDTESLAALHAAFERGVRIIDTADQYGGGHAEAVIAQALSESSIPRDDFVICTKVGMVCDPETGNITGVTSDGASISAAIDASLAKRSLEPSLVHSKQERSVASGGAMTTLMAQWPLPI